MIEFDLTQAKLQRSDLERMRPGALDGRSVYGHRMGRLNRGTGYWTGTVEFVQRSRRSPDGRKGMAYLESILAHVKETGEDFKVPMFRNHDLLAAADSAGNAVDLSSLTVTVGAGGVLEVPQVGGRDVTLTALAGTRITVGNDLYLCRGATQTLTATKPVTTPEFPSAASTAEVELIRPFAIGIVLPETNLRMPRRGSWGGPYPLAWIEA